MSLIIHHVIVHRIIEQEQQLKVLSEPKHAVFPTKLNNWLPS